MVIQSSTSLDRVFHALADPTRRAMLGSLAGHQRTISELSGTGCILSFTQEGIDIAEELRQLPPGVEGGSEQGWRLMFDMLAEVASSQ